MTAMVPTVMSRLGSSFKWVNEVILKWIPDKLVYNFFKELKPKVWQNAVLIESVIPSVFAFKTCEIYFK